MNNEDIKIQWFPGHMAKTRRLMKESLPLVDILVEVLDARIPISSRNPEIDKIAGDKPRLLLLNKADYADESVTGAWCQTFKERGMLALAADCRSGRGLKAFTPAVYTVLAEHMAKLKAKGMSGRPMRIMVVGIPNVGKSSFINRMAGAKRAKAEDRPGVTRGRQWVKLEGGMELLDMPGVLWPKFDDKRVGFHLAFTGAIKDDILDIEGLTTRLLHELKVCARPMLMARYKLSTDEMEGIEDHDLLNLIGRKRGMLLSGDRVDTARAASVILDEFRGGVIGRISLERPRVATVIADNMMPQNPEELDS